MGIFDNGIRVLENLGVYDVILPFVLIFAVIFGILEQVQIFGENKRKIHIVIALVMGCAVVFPHIVNNNGGNITPDVIPIMNDALPNIMVVIVAIMCVLIMIGTFGITTGNEEIAKWKPYIAIASLVIVTYVFFAAAGGIRVPSWLSFITNPETATLIIILLVFGSIIYYVTGEPTE